MTAHGRYKSLLPILVTSVAVLLILAYIIPGVFTSPAHLYPSLGGDGMKNEFTYLYHVLYGKGIWFSGMNYPYGEHIIYTDGQPLLAVPLAWLHHHYAFSLGAAMAMMLWAMMLSYVLGGIYLWKILALQGMNRWLAIAFSLGILLLSPQIMRMTGHFGLAYICIVPMKLYWLLRYHAGGGKKYVLYFFVAIIIFSLLHLYMLPLSLLIAGGYLLHQMFSRKLTRAEKRRRLLPLLIAVTLATLIIQAGIRLTDPVKDRPAVPLGFARANTSPQQIFTSAYSPIWQGIESAKLVPKLSEPDEGNAYIGVVATVILIAALVQAGWLYHKRKTAVAPLLPAPFIFLIFFSIIIGMGVPFIWGLYDFGEQLPLVNQFRTLGRFSWIFYYLSTIYAALVINQWALRMRASRRRPLAVAFVIVLLFVWAVDVNGYVLHLKKNTQYWDYNYDYIQSKNEPTWKDFLAAKGYKASDFQSLLILPYVHIGTEKIWVGQEYESGGWVITLAGKASLQLHLPIMDVMMSRSSWQQAKEQIKVAGGRYCFKPVLAALKDPRPILLMVFNEEKLSPDLEYLREGADSIGLLSQCRIYVLHPERLLAKEKTAGNTALQLSLHMKQRDTCTGTDMPWYCLHADGPQPFRTKLGAFKWGGSKEGNMLLAALPLDLRNDSLLYEWSCWTLAPARNYRTADFLLRGYDSAGHQLFEREAPTSWACDAEGNWYRASRFLVLPQACKELRTYLTGKATDISSYATDELQLRPADALIISHNKDGKLLLNNHFYKKE